MTKNLVPMLIRPVVEAALRRHDRVIRSDPGDLQAIVGAIGEHLDIDQPKLPAIERSAVAVSVLALICQRLPLG